MYKNLLIATDGSDIAHRAVEHGVALAGKLGCHVTILTVTEPWDSIASGEAMLTPIGDFEERQAEGANKVLARAAQVAKDLKVEHQTLHIVHDSPAQAILDTAQNRNCDLIVMSSHGRRGLSRMLLGSQANKVVTLSSIPVLVCKAPRNDGRERG